MELNRSLELLTESDENTCIKRRTNLEKCLVVAIIVGGCGVLGFIINASSEEDKAPCTTPSCVLAAAQLLNQMDEEVDPCEDFYHFACGRLINETNEKHIPSNLLESKIEKQLLKLLQEPIDKNDHTAVNYEKHIFQGCVDAKESYKSFEKLQQILNDISGWPVVVGSDWNATDFDWTKLLRSLEKNGLYISSMLRLDIVIDPDDATMKIIRIDNPSVHESESKNEAYKKMMIDVAIVFGAQSAQANLDMEQVIQFINELRLLHSNTSKSTRLTVEDFRKRHQFDWLNYINIILPPAKQITNQDYVIFRDAELYDDFFSLLKKTGNRTIANYMIWRAVEDVLPLLSDDLQDVYNDYQCLSGTPMRRRVDTCRVALKESFSPLATHLLYAEKHLTPSVKEKTLDIFNRIKDEFLRSLKLSTWMSSQDKEKAEHTFNTLMAVIGINEATVDASVFEKIFRGALEPIAHDNFLKMFLYHRRKFESIWVEYMLTHQQREWINTIFNYHYISELTTAYLPDDNMLILPVGMLHDLYYDEDKPMYVNFGTLGRTIGVALTNIFLKFGKNPKSNITWSEDTEKGYDETTKCISERTELFMTDYIDLEVVEITGLKLGHNAYVKWLEENGNEPDLVGISYDQRQMYWISALFGLCFEEIDYGFNLYFDNKPIFQNAGFANDFRCPVNSKMNPSRRCNIF